MRHGGPSKQTQFRLPPWAVDFIEHAARERGTSKTQVVLDALECFREQELAQQMAEGYEAVEAADERLTDDLDDSQAVW